MKKEEDIKKSAKKNKKLEEKIKEDIGDFLISSEEYSGETNKENNENPNTQGKSSTTSSRKRRSSKLTRFEQELMEGEENVVTKSVEQVIHESMLPYSEYVIMDRALPRVEDGLKPVQRRVLYSMLEVGVLPDRPFRKSARIVGDCMGKYHPHGDRSIYDTMVRMAQSFNMGEVLVNGHGNFGSVDGDGAAAMRYTEAKLAPLSLELLKDIEKDTVAWGLNFDDSCKEPQMLPGRYPNLLVNGSTGIAVGLATNIPTHNLREACNAVCAYITNPQISLKELLEIMPGPDFPTGGYLLTTSDIENVYKTGKGKLLIRSKLHIENADNGKKNIVITETPFQVNKANMLQKIATLKENDQTGLLNYISEIVDESDRNGTRAVIRLKKDAKVSAILNLLYKITDMQTSFNANMVAIADGKPKQLGLIEIIDYYVKYQQKVIYNRTKFDLEACLKKEHILEGLLIAIKNIDEVIAIIRKSKSVTDAKIKLIQKYSLSEAQAQAILDMRLARLTNLEVNKLVDELNRLKELIKRFTAILKSPAMQMKIVKQELKEIAAKYGRDRRTQFLDPKLEELEEEDNYDSSIGNEEVNIFVSPSCTIKSVTQKSYNLATKELSANPTVYEIPHLGIKTTTEKTIYLFTNLGNCVKVLVSKIDQCKLKDKGANLSLHYKNLALNEFVVSMIEFSENDKDNELIFFTKQGMIKISKLSEYFASKQVIVAIKLKDDDELIGVEVNKQTTKAGLFTKSGIGMIVEKNDISTSGRASIGVKGIALSEGDFVVSAMQVSASDGLTIFADNGMMQILKCVFIPQSTRNKKGSRIITIKDKSPSLVKVNRLNEKHNFVVESQDSKLHFVKTKDILVDKIFGKGNYIKGVKGNKVVKNIYNYITTH